MNVSRCAPIGQNSNPPSPREPEAIPQGADLAACIETARGRGTVAENMRGILRGLVKSGKLPVEVLALIGG